MLHRDRRAGLHPVEHLPRPGLRRHARGAARAMRGRHGRRGADPALSSYNHLDRRAEQALTDQSSSLNSTRARPYGSFPTPVTVPTTFPVRRSITHTVPLGTKVVRGPPAITA